MPQPQRTSETIDWDKEEINWQKNRITELNDKLENKNKREEGQNRLINKVLTEKYVLEEQIDIQAGQIASLEEENSSIRERLAAYEGMNDSQAPKEKLSSLLDSWKDGQMIDQKEFLRRLSSKLGDIKEYIDKNTPPRSPQQDLDLN